MAKKFMFVCIGIMALAVTFHIGAQYGKAGFVDHTSTGIVAVQSTGHMLLDNGEVWFFHDGGPSWTRKSEFDLPVSVSQVRFWLNEKEFVSVQNDVWYRSDLSLECVNYGPPPGGVATEPSTWGKVKAKFQG